MDSDLIRAAKEGDLKKVKGLIFQEGRALIHAAENGHLDVVKYLISAGVNPRVEDGRALGVAAYYGHLDVVKYLYSQGVTKFSRDEALGEAAGGGHLDIIQYLLQQGVDVNALEGQALINAAWAGNLPIVKFLVAKGADLHAQEDRVITDAIEEKRLEVAMYLLPLLTPQSREKALRLAMETKSSKILEFLTDIYPGLLPPQEAVSKHNRDRLLVAKHILPVHTLAEMVASYY